MDAKKERFDEESAWALLKSAKKIIVAKGRHIQEWVPSDQNKNEILQKVMGPSGNLRAPTLKIKDTFIVGFHEETFSKYFGT